MNCPKCGMKMNNIEYCFHCGYMRNGNTIDTKKEISPSMLELYFGDCYNKYTRNRNWVVAGVFGPIYIFCHSHYIIGLLLILVDFLVSILFFVFNHAFLYYYVVLLLNIIYTFCNRILWATIGNIIYLKLLTRRLEKIKRRDYNYYCREVANLYKKDNRFILLKYIIFGIVFWLLFYIAKKTLYDELGLL